MNSKESKSGQRSRGLTMQLRALLAELVFAGRLFVIAVVVLIFVASLLENTSSVFRVLCSGVMVAVGAAAYPRRLPYRVCLFVLGCAVVVAATFVTVRTTDWNYEPLTAVPGSGFGRSIAAWVRERDAVLTGVRILRIFQGVTSREALGLEASMSKAYDDMEASVGIVPSPLLRSVVLGQMVGTPDTLVFDLRDTAPQGGTVVFLHGTGGSWSLGCWLVARAAARAHFATVCPSAGPLGLWGVDSSGVVRRTIQHIKASEQGPVVLVGLSAGAVGVGQIAPLLGDEIAGAVMLFGGHPAARGAFKPLLLVYGDQDERFPVRIMRFVRDSLSGSEQRLTAVELPSADHMALLKRGDEVEAAVADWLGRLSAGASKENFLAADK